MLCLFAMIVPFQMEMFTLSKIANMLHMGNPWGLVVIYLGFGAGLSVFMFTGFMKSIPLEIEEAAMMHTNPDILQNCTSDCKADLRNSYNSSGNVDLERLPASITCTGSEKI